MPLHDLSQEGRLCRFDILGYCRDQTRFVTHVGFCSGDIERLEPNHATKWVHMRPPLSEGDDIQVHAAGFIPLTNEEINELAAWIEERKDEYRTARALSGCEQYVISPAWEDVRDNNTGVHRYRRYSCAGFVLDGHLQVEIELLETDADSLPEVSRESLELAYGRIRDPHSVMRFGLSGEGPWRIVLPGYVIRALNRSEDEIRSEPYRAAPGDECIPS